ncbi:MAG: hypothetical protein GC204_08440 [Chloroflexi bacterium]|nr:hypothetical protein [Chloroflexota bacterium]
MPNDYSKSPLVKKLAIKPKMRITVINAPEGYRELLGELPEGTTFEPKFEGMFDWNSGIREKSGGTRRAASQNERKTRADRHPLDHHTARPQGD